jgi:hypothetical protein
MQTILKNVKNEPNYKLGTLTDNEETRRFTGHDRGILQWGMLTVGEGCAMWGQGAHGMLYILFNFGMNQQLP